jgi:hypothetical protein
MPLASTLRLFTGEDLDAIEGMRSPYPYVKRTRLSEIVAKHLRELEKEKEIHKRQLWEGKNNLQSGDKFISGATKAVAILYVMGLAITLTAITSLLPYEQPELTAILGLILQAVSVAAAIAANTWGREKA